MHRFTLEPYKGPKSRHHCPQCNHRTRTFSRYIDADTGQYLGDNAGRCSRENNCGYHLSPAEYFKSTGGIEQSTGSKSYQNNCRPSIPKKQPTTDYLPAQLVNGSFTAYTQNNFIKYLISLFGDEVTYNLTDRYNIGTSMYWHGATVFWQIDKQGKVRTGKIMLYNPDTGRRVKEPFNHVAWAHTLLCKSESRESQQRPEEAAGKVKTRQGVNNYLSDFRTSRLSDFNLNQCLFGEHLLDSSHPLYNGEDKPIAIVESEKTAIIASVYLPQYLWMATGSMHNLNAAKCQVLKGRKIMLYPDVNAYKTWQQKAADIQLLLPGTTITVSGFLELNADERARKESWDIGDYLVG